MEYHTSRTADTSIKSELLNALKMPVLAVSSRQSHVIHRSYDEHNLSFILTLTFENTFQVKTTPAFLTGIIQQLKWPLRRKTLD